MILGTIVNTIIKEGKYKKANLARALDISPQALNGRLSQDRNMTSKVASSILDVLGYQIVVTKKGAKLPPDSYVVTESDS